MGEGENYLGLGSRRRAGCGVLLKIRDFFTTPGAQIVPDGESGGTVAKGAQLSPFFFPSGVQLGEGPGERSHADVGRGLGFSGRTTLQTGSDVADGEFTARDSSPYTAASAVASRSLRSPAPVLHPGCRSRPIIRGRVCGAGENGRNKPSSAIIGFDITYNEAHNASVWNDGSEPEPEAALCERVRV